MTINANGIVTCLQDFGVYCITLCISEVIALGVLAVGICQLIRRKKNFKQAQKRKNIIYILIILCLTSQKTLMVFYFFQLYVYYTFLIYIVFYFARKTVKIKTFQPQKMLQLKIYCICLIFLFTLFLLWNFYDYITSIHDPYSLCQSIYISYYKNGWFYRGFSFNSSSPFFEPKYQKESSIKINYFKSFCQL
ncbi:unnamed protein product [Paramecium sonneborni]|uniref:Transmembrane protein n=1 Tax=Paramecium sonneborni TaxID=65129 RepID=A0A8S1L9C8_9CILI|nr:unnamed protein product [Paramecium sonneborni]